MCWSVRQETLRSSRKGSLEQSLAGPGCNQELEHGWKPGQLCIKAGNATFSSMDATESQYTMLVLEKTRVCLHMLRSPPRVMFSSTRREQLSILTDQAKTPASGTSCSPVVLHLCACSQEPVPLPSVSGWQHHVCHSQQQAASFVLSLEGLRLPGLVPLLALNFAWPACSSGLLGWVVTAISVTDQVPLASLFYFSLSLCDTIIVLYM